jgi:hypothetical protein
MIFLLHLPAIKITLFCLLIFLTFNAVAQSKDAFEPEIFKYVEQMPEFNGDVNQYLAEHVKYPRKALH